MECSEGFTMVGSGTRSCVYLTAQDRVGWDGSPAQCQKITCPGLIVSNAEVPGGTCVLPNGQPSTSYEYGTTCTYKCSRGYRYSGDLERRCQLTGEWSGTKPKCTEVRCDQLPTVALGRYLPDNLGCDQHSHKFDTICTHRCPTGYHMDPGSDVDITNVLKCSNDTGRWEGAQRSCKDHDPPELTCPTDDITVPNDKGQKTASVSWSFSFDDNSLREGETSKENFQVVLAINGNETGPALPKMLELGINRISYKVTDPAGNPRTCSFKVTVEDTEPPTCTSCPSDIIKDDLTTSMYRPTWDSPQCSDNSGLPPAISATRRNGDSLSVPGTYAVKYTITDRALNSYDNCSFTIKLIKPQCKEFAPPKNGASKCWSWRGSKNCQVSCMTGHDFVYEAAYSYLCDGGIWNAFGPSTRIPWPDCSKRANPSMVKMQGLPGFFYDGDCNDPNVQAQLVNDFLTLMNIPFIPGPFCRENPHCNPQNIKVHCGELDASVRRRKRSTTKKFTIKLDYVEKSKAITPESDDASEQVLYDDLKKKVDGERTQVYEGLKKVDWGAFKVKSGLDLGGGAEKFNLKNVDAYCAESGAVVRKCNTTDMDYVYYKRCNKEQEVGDITKCIRCPVGTYYNEDKDNCAVCPEGQFVNEEGALKCNQCPEGTWTFGAQKENFTSCQAECGPGFHSRMGIAPCFPCPAGGYSSEKRNRKCVTCPPGTTSIAAASKRLEDCGMQCAAGTYSHNGVEPCQPCPAGTYQNGTGQIACLPCPGRLSTYGVGADNVQSCVEVNDCVSSPCNNQGRCVDTKESYRCECPPGFLGLNCETETDECANRPCFGGATCVNRVNGYACLCPPNYSGTKCDQPVHACDTQNPCVRGSCVEKASGAQCECPIGYEGEFCEIDVDECASTPCQNNGVCIGGLDTFQCVCRSGYSGQLCQVNTNDCASDLCQNGGTCVDGERAYSCHCVPGYTGAYCESEVEECQAEPCRNGGKCTNTFNGYQCSCPPTYSGENCTQQLSSDYDLSFQSRVSKPYATTLKHIPDMSEVTVALWLRTDDTNPGTALSYATQDGDMLQDNALALQDFSGLNLFVNNQTAFLDIDIVDGFWHHVAVTWHSASGGWKAYVDGKLFKTSVAPFQQNQRIVGGGIMIVGQDQDELGGGFNTEEAFIGDLSQVNVWGRVLSDNEVYNLANSCADVKGDIVAWADFQEGLSGSYSLTTTSYACKFDDIMRYVTHTSNASIPSHNDAFVSSISPLKCAAVCDRITGIQCRSFDYDKQTKRCYLSVKHSADNLISHDATARYDYYQMNCQRAIGVQSSNTIPDDKMTASSYLVGREPRSGRLKNTPDLDENGVKVRFGSWTARDSNSNQWLQVEFADVKRVMGVATQGQNDEDRWVTSYKLKYSLDGGQWTTYPTTLNGNTDQDTIVRHEVHAFNAKYVRFCPQAWHNYVSMRVEVYGCPQRKTYPSDTVNECSSNPCAHGAVCVNRLGGYLCRCPRGYTGPRCATELPCSDPGTPVYGSKSSSNYQPGSTITFSCQSGYALTGSASRTCHGGQWTGTQPRCEDRDECVGNHRCAQLCINTPGRFHCACAKGYRLTLTDDCADIDECATNNGGCSHFCYNNPGGVTCGCPSGLTFTNGRRTCVDVNECATNNGGCQHTCVNTHRSFKCLCNRGFRLNANGKNCDPLSCPSLPSISQGQVQTSSNLVGGTASYTCQEGYRVIGSKVRDCQADTTWSGIQPTCARVYCREVGTVKNAARSLVSYLNGRPVVGSIARFTCNANHVMQGSRDLRCQGDGTWSGDLPRCIPAFCAKLNAPANGEVKGFRFELDATLRVTCNTGYVLKPAESSFRTCVSSSGGGRWSGQDPRCELIDCGDPGPPYGGYRAVPGGTKYLAVTTHTCKPKHHLQGEPTQTCHADGQWSGKKPVCLEHSCGYLDAPANGKKHGYEHTYNKTVTFECDTGYNLMGSASRTCQTNGLWTGTQPTCQIVNCGDPGTPANGLRFGDQLTYKSFLHFECDAGYKLAGTISRECQSDGRWSGSQPTCSATNCGRLRVGPTGTIQSYNYPNNYRDNEYCTWEIQVPVNKKVRLDFKEFKTVAGEDYLLVYDTGSHLPTIAFDGTNRPFSFTSSGRSLRLRFITNGSNNMKGFKVAYKQVDRQCGGTLTDKTGTIVSPNFPNHYDSFGFDLDCVWLIARPFEKIELAFLVFDTEPTYDGLYIYQGRQNSTNAVIAKGRSGLGTPVYPYVVESYLWVQFRTNYITTDGNHQGFHAEYYPYNPYFVPKKKK